MTAMTTRPIHWETLAARIAVAPPGTATADGHRTTTWAIAINGDAITAIDAGPSGRKGLFTFVERIHRELLMSCITEHDAGQHTSPEVGCPLCEQAQARDTDEGAAARDVADYATRAARHASLGLPAPLPYDRAGV